MSDDLIRASLDQALLALAAMDAGNVEEATARAAIGQIFATAAVASRGEPAATPFPGAGPRSGSITRTSTEIDAFQKWQEDLASSSTVGLPEVTPPVPEAPVLPEPTAPLRPSRRPSP